MMRRSLAIAAITFAGSSIACAQSVYLYVAPGASVYVSSMPNGAYYNGAPAVHPQGAYGPPPVVAAPVPASVYGPVAAPEVYLAPAYAPTYAPPLAYGAAPGLVAVFAYPTNTVLPPSSQDFGGGGY
jgi:hypothetical protein